MLIILYSFFHIITDSVRKNPLSQSATDKEVEETMKKYFRGVNDRQGGRSERSKKIPDVVTT